MYFGGITLCHHAWCTLFNSFFRSMFATFLFCLFYLSFILGFHVDLKLVIPPSTCFIPSFLCTFPFCIWRHFLIHSYDVWDLCISWYFMHWDEEIYDWLDIQIEWEPQEILGENCWNISWRTKRNGSNEAGTEVPSVVTLKCPLMPPTSADFLLCLILCPVDGGDIFLRIIGLSPNYTAF
jgi:hypothetical protein